MDGFKLTERQAIKAWREVRHRCRACIRVGRWASRSLTRTAARPDIEESFRYNYYGGGVNVGASDFNHHPCCSGLRVSRRGDARVVICNF